MKPVKLFEEKEKVLKLPRKETEGTGKDFNPTVLYQNSPLLPQIKSIHITTVINNDSSNAWSLKWKSMQIISSVTLKKVF